MFLEVRSAEGGDDARLFATQLAGALSKYARTLGCSVNPVSSSESKTLVFDVVGKTEALRPFVGTHRIQRIPVNDRKGRRHTSTATVALLDEPSKLDVDIRDEDLVMTTYKGSGPGGQHRNKTDTAVRLTHLPTGLVVSAEDSKSQWSNRQSAMKKLSDTITFRMRESAAKQKQFDRRGQIASGERPVKEYTWNDQRGEVLDHSTGKRWRMSDAMKGKLG